MTTKTRTALLAELDTFYPDNTLGEISPEDLRLQQANVIDSMMCILTDGIVNVTACAGTHTADQGPTGTDVAHQVLFSAGIVAYKLGVE